MVFFCNKNSKNILVEKFNKFYEKVPNFKKGISKNRGIPYSQLKSLVDLNPISATEALSVNLITGTIYRDEIVETHKESFPGNALQKKVF